MSIAFDCFCLILLFVNPTTVVFSTCMGVGGWGCPSSSRVVRIGKAYLEFRKVAPILASAAEDMPVLMIWHRVWMAPLLVGRVGGLSPFSTSRLARKMASSTDTCLFFSEIGNIARNMEEYVAGMIVDYGIGVGRSVI